MRRYVKADLVRMVENGRTLSEIGYVYGVSRQRIYQLLSAFGIKTPEKRRKRQSDNWSDKQKWLWRAVVNSIGTSGSKVDKLTLFESLGIPDKCPILGLTLDYSIGKGSRTENSPSLYRIDSSKGYVKNNVHVISWRANRIKNDATVQELQDIANYFKQFEK